MSATSISSRVVELKCLFRNYLQNLHDPLARIRLRVSYISSSNGCLGLDQEVEVRHHVRVHSSLLHSGLRSSGTRAHVSQSH